MVMIIVNYTLSHKQRGCTEMQENTWARLRESRAQGASRNLAHVFSCIAAQGSSKEWFLGCVIPASWPPLAVGAHFTQPRDHSFPDPCTIKVTKIHRSFSATLYV